MRELHPKIKSTKELSKEAFTDLKSFQVGDKKLVKTGKEFIDCHIGGVAPSQLILLGGGSGSGKTKMAMDMVNNILDVNINPEANDYVTLEFMLEMKFLDLVLREAHALTKKKKSEILTEEFNEDHKVLMNEYYKALNDGRRYIVDETINSKEFLEISESFCEQHKDKKNITILIDHLLLILSDQRGEDPLEKVATYTNILRKKFNNVTFLYISQLNRSAYSVIKEKSNDMIPTVATIYGSSHFEFLSSYVAIITNPFRLGVQEYMKVKKDRYSYLSEFMTSPDAKNNVSFKTLGNITIHVVKTRESDHPYNNLYIEKMDLSEEQLNKMKMDVQAEEKAPQIEIPNFDYQMGRDVKPLIDLTEAFDV